MDINRIDKLCNWLRYLGNRPDALNSPVFNSDMVKIHEEIIWIAKDIEKEQPLLEYESYPYKSVCFWKNY